MANISIFINDIRTFKIIVDTVIFMPCPKRKDRDYGDIDLYRFKVYVEEAFSTCGQVPLQQKIALYVRIIQSFRHGKGNQSRCREEKGGDSHNRRAVL